MAALIGLAFVWGFVLGAASAAVWIVWRLMRCQDRRAAREIEILEEWYAR